MEHDVSIIVATYNPSRKKLLQTIRSIVIQQDVKYEIIIADDGSKDLDIEFIENFFERISWSEYKIIKNQDNRGTVENLYSALLRSDGQYIKVISPGDFLYDEFTLSRWIRFMETGHAEVSFGNAVYYSIVDDDILIHKTKGNPVFRKLFLNSASRVSRRNIFCDYMVANDTVLGAAVMMKRNVMMKYMQMIVGKIVYAEDMMVRIMIYEGKNVAYMNDYVVWYEYGTGISTSKNTAWKRILKKDYDACNRILLTGNLDSDDFGGKYLRYLEYSECGNKCSKIIKFVLFPDILYWRIKLKAQTAKLPEKIKRSVIEELLKMEDTRYYSL